MNAAPSPSEHRAADFDAALRHLAAESEGPLTQARSDVQALRTHEVVRRLRAPAAAEATTRAARASAALAGARVPVTIVRDAARGAIDWPDDAAGLTVRGAFRAVSALPPLQTVWPTAPLQAMARLHTVSTAGLIPESEAGRPRTGAQLPTDGADLLTSAGDNAAELTPVPAPVGAALTARIEGIADLLTHSATAPAVLVAALVMAEFSVARPFVSGNGVVGRALARGVLIGRGVDVNGFCQWEEALLSLGPQPTLALAAYADGSRSAVQQWVTLFAEAVIGGAQRGKALADGVLTGRL